VVSAVIVVERTEEGHALPVQRAVYYVSEVLSETKAHYPQVQKLLYAVVLARCKLRHYFEAHPVTVISSFPLGEIIRNLDAAGRFLCGLRIAMETGIKRLDVRGDSQLVINQFMKNASCHYDKMEAYCKAVWALEDKFYGIELNHVPCRYNEEADELTKIASG
jgi:hypothetical protein